MDFITDRTQTNVQRLKELAVIGYANMTASEREEWNSGMRGAYNATDLNRVETAVATLSATLRALPNDLRSYAEGLLVAWNDFFGISYDPTVLDLQTRSWSMDDIPTAAEMARYLSNVKTLRGTFDFDMEDLPESMERLTVDGANAIEKALMLLSEEIDKFRAKRTQQIDNTAAAWFYSGDLYANEV